MGFHAFIKSQPVLKIKLIEPIRGIHYQSNRVRNDHNG